MTRGVTLAKLLNEPKVMLPDSRAGSGVIGGASERLIAEKSSRQADQLFRVERVGQARRIGQRVGDPIIHGRHAGGVLIAEISDLHRSRLAGEDQQPAPSHVAGQIDQDVDFVFAHQRGDLFVGLMAHVAPVVGGPLKPGGGFVGVERG